LRFDSKTAVSERCRITACHYYSDNNRATRCNTVGQLTWHHCIASSRNCTTYTSGADRHPFRNRPCSVLRLLISDSSIFHLSAQISDAQLLHESLK